LLEINKIYNMDCLEGMDVMIQQGIKVDAVITDIPYGTTQCSWDAVIPFDKMWNKLKLLRYDNTPIILFGKQPFTSFLNISNINEFRYEIIWEKDKGTDFGNAKRKPLNIHENISVFYKKQPTYNVIYDLGKPYIRKNKRSNNTEDLNFKSDNRTYQYFIKNNSGIWINKGKRTPTTIRKFNRVSAGGQKPLHPTEKPLELIEWLIKSYSLEGDLILDFTIGSGTTAIACINTNRNFIGFELNKEYYEIAKNRINKRILDNNLQDKYNLIT